jgi:hypothetical protein
MKKTIILVAIAIFSLASCKKDYTCECTTSYGIAGVADVKSEVAYKDVKKKDAKASCNALSTTVGTASTKCEMK